jgi:hypothetical protein
MFGIDQTKVSSHVRESFSKMKGNVANGNGQVVLNTQTSNKTPSKLLQEEEKIIVPARRKSNTNKSAESKSEYYA